MKERINKETLEALLEKSQNTDLAKKYRAWLKLDLKDKEYLTYLGTVDAGQKLDEEYPSLENYWSPNHPIALEFYPYYGCEVYSDGNSYFLVYQEFGGHVPEKRCRSVSEELLV